MANQEYRTEAQVNGQIAAKLADADVITVGTLEAAVAATPAVAANTAKVGITSGQAAAIVANTAKVGISTAQANAITANTAKVGYTDGLVAASPAVTANTAKVGITAGQASAITANTAKVGYTDGLVAASPAVVANTAKVGITAGQASAITANTAKVGITTAQANAITANTAKVGYTDALVAASPAVVANTAKVGITTAQANAIVANTAKVGITPQQATDIAETKGKVEELPLMNSDQFQEMTNGQIALYKYFIKLGAAATEIAFNFNYIIGGLLNASIGELYLLLDSLSQEFNKCIVFSQADPAPAILTDLRIKFEGAEYSTVSNEVNILTFEYIGPDHVLCVNRIWELPLVIPAITNFYSITRNTTTLTIDFTSCPVGELMVVAMANLVAVAGTGYAYSAPAGWDVVINQSNGLDIWTRKKEEGDSDIQTFGIPSLPDSGGTIAMSISGTDYVNGSTSSLIIGTPTTEGNTANKAIPAISLPQTSLCLAIHGVASTNTTTTVFSAGWEELIENSRPTNFRRIAVAKKVADATSGTATATIDTGQNNIGIIIGFKS